jgi:tetratricopeptide (TPR) repeat protein
MFLLLFLLFCFIICRAQQNACACLTSCNSIIANGGFEGPVGTDQGSPNISVDCWNTVAGSPHIYDKDNNGFTTLPFVVFDPSISTTVPIVNVNTWNNVPQNDQVICITSTERFSGELLQPFSGNVPYELSFRYTLLVNSTTAMARVGFSQNFITGNNPWTNPNLVSYDYALSFSGFNSDGFNVWDNVTEVIINTSGQDFNFIYVSLVDPSGQNTVFLDDFSLIPSNLTNIPEPPLTLNQMQGDSDFHICENDSMFLEVLPQIECPVFWSVIGFAPNEENPNIIDTTFTTISTDASIWIYPADETLTYFVSTYGCGSWEFEVIPMENPSVSATVVDTYVGICEGSIELNTANADDLTDWTFFWTLNDTPMNINDASIEDLCAGDYSVVVSNDSNCSSTYDFVVNELVLPEYDLVVTQNTCLSSQCNGSIAIESEMAFDLVWLNGPMAGQTIEQISNLCGGIYQASLTFENLPSFTISVEVDEPLALVDPVFSSSVVFTNESLVVQGNMTVSSTANFVDCTFYFEHNKSLKVEQGGDLNADKTIFTSACPNLYWAGIEVHGVADASQDTPGAQGRAKFSNDCLIEKALVGLRSGKIYFLSLNPFLHWTVDDGGAILEAENTTFRNNERDLYFAHYPNYINSSVFTNCNFETNQNFILTDAIGYQHPLHNRATLVSNRFVTFQNCKFRNYSVPLLNSFPDVSAIYAQNSNFSFLGSANSPHAAILEGFPRGIYSFGTFSGPEMNVLENVTFRCYRGAYYRDLLTASITGNRFYELSSSTIAPFPDVPQGYLDDDPDNTYINEFDVVQNTFMPFCKGSYGLYLDYPVAFILTENLFRLAGPPNMLRVGLYVNGNDMHPNDVYKNTFANMTAGCRFYNDNRGPNQNSGLTYQCNTFLDNERNVEINNQPGFQGTTDFGVRTQVGTPLTSSGNEMDQNTIDLNDVDNIANYTGNAHTYYYTTGELVQEEIFDIVEILSSQNNTCPSLIVGVVNDDINLLLADYLDAKEDYFEYIDAGNTNGTLTEIQLAQYTNALELYYELIGISPALSEEALLAAISRAGDIPPILLAGILASNPIAARSTTIQKSLDNLAMPLSEYQRTMINQGMYVVGLRESMDASLGELVTRLNTATLKEYRRILDEEDPLTQTSLLDDLTLLRSDQEAAYFRITWLINQKRFTEARSLIASISATQPELMAEKADYEAYENVLELYEELIFTPRPITIAEKSNLEAFIDPRKPNTTRLALDILSNQGLSSYHEPLVYADQMGLTRTISIHNPNVQVELYSIFPNPADNFIQVKASDQRSLYRCEIEISDIAGRSVYYASGFESSIQETLIDLSGILSGNYILSIIYNQEVIYTSQFSKQ